MFHGLRAGGQGRSNDAPPMANSQVASLPRMTAPAAFSRVAIRSAASVQLPAETVVLVSISSL